jgi:hypothetical protein
MSLPENLTYPVLFGTGCTCPQPAIGCQNLQIGRLYQYHPLANVLYGGIAGVVALRLIIGEIPL